MKKVRLNLDALKVTSFDTETSPRGERGTVRAHGNVPAETGAVSCYYSGCANIYNTCGWSCNCVTDTDNVVFCH
jgi:hypothetical protein